MRLKIFATVVAIAMIMAYYAPVVIKLKELPLTVVALGGLALATIDALQSLRSRNDRS